MNKFLTATDEEIEEWVNSPSIVGNGNINLYHPLTTSNIQQFWKEYHCDRCGKCCLGKLFPKEIGLVLTNVESKRLAGIKRIPVEEFKYKFTVIRNDRLLMTYPCSFYDADAGCSIYQDQPEVCRLYPINLPVKAEGYHPQIDGIYLMTVDSYCPEARKVAVKWLKAMRDAYTTLISLDKDKFAETQNKVLIDMENVREWQKGIRKI